MRSKITFEEIQLLSIKDRKAIRINLSNEKIVIYGKNDTGKSTLIKGIFWLMGLEPTHFFSGGRLDKNLSGILKIRYNNDYYYFYRNRETRKLFNSNYLILKDTISNSDWQAFLADLFNYNLSLVQYNNLEEYLIGLQGLLTPYYIDQDTGWDSKWNGPFDGLTRYIDFYQRVIEHFTGIISKDTIELKKQQKILNNSKKEFELKLKIYKQSGDELINDKDILLPEVDKDLYINRIKDSTDIFKSLTLSQNNLKHEINDLLSEKLKVKNLLKSAIKMYNESLEDLKSLNKIEDNTIIECPTCGVFHEKSFKANIAIEFDIQGIEENIFFLKNQLAIINDQEKNLILKLKSINNEIESFEINLHKKSNENYSLHDIIKAYSLKDLKLNINKSINNILSELNIIEGIILNLQNRIDQLDTPKSIKEKKDNIKKIISYYYNQLEVDSLNLPSRIHIKPKLSGSSSSRSILAMHLSYIYMNYKITDFPIFPLTVDTIQQNGQDIQNLNNMVKVISSIEFTQVILGMETLSENLIEQGFKIIKLNNAKYSLLSEVHYHEVFKNINNLLNQPINNLL